MHWPRCRVGFPLVLVSGATLPCDVLSCFGSTALEQRLSNCGSGGLVALRHVGLSPSQGSNCVVPCVGGRILIHCTTRNPYPLYHQGNPVCLNKRIILFTFNETSDLFLNFKGSFCEGAVCLRSNLDNNNWQI